MRIPGFRADESIGIPKVMQNLKTIDRRTDNQIVLQGIAPDKQHVKCGPCQSSLLFPEYTGLLSGCNYQKCCVVDDTGTPVPYGCALNMCGCSLSGMSYDSLSDAQSYAMSDIFRRNVSKYVTESAYAYSHNWPY